jgi:phage I-like protein
MPQQFGYWVDLQGKTFDDGVVNWMQAMPLGHYDHPEYGDIDFTDTTAKEYADNIKAKVRGQDLDIDYDHKKRTDEAAGWIKDAEARPDGLWVAVEWTKAAAEKIKDKAYRYFSPEFVDAWTHPKTGVTHKNVLFGGALTNRPFLKDILPINMSEVFDNASKPKGVGMDPKQLRKMLGLAEDASDEDVTKKLEELTKPPEPPKNDKKDEEPAKLTEEEEALKKLAEGNPFLKKVLEDQEAMKKQMAEQAVQLREAQAKDRVIKLTEAAEAAKRGLPPVLTEPLQKFFAEAPKKYSDQIEAALEAFAKAGFVPLGERGAAAGRSSTSNEDAGKKFNEAVKAKQLGEEKLEYADAVSAVSSEQPELWEAYRQSSFANSPNEEV